MVFITGQRQSAQARLWEAWHEDVLSELRLSCRIFKDGVYTRPVCRGVVSAGYGAQYDRRCRTPNRVRIASSEWVMGVGFLFRLSCPRILQEGVFSVMIIPAAPLSLGVDVLSCGRHSSYFSIFAGSSVALFPFTFSRCRSLAESSRMPVTTQ